jgi:hypothetical protein
MRRLACPKDCRLPTVDFAETPQGQTQTHDKTHTYDDPRIPSPTPDTRRAAMGICDWGSCWPWAGKAEDEAAKAPAAILPGVITGGAAPALSLRRNLGFVAMPAPPFVGDPGGGVVVGGVRGRGGGERSRGLSSVGGMGVGGRWMRGWVLAEYGGWMLVARGIAWSTPHRFSNPFPPAPSPPQNNTPWAPPQPGSKS